MQTSRLATNKKCDAYDPAERGRCGRIKGGCIDCSTCNWFKPKLDPVQILTNKLVTMPKAEAIKPVAVVVTRTRKCRPVIFTMPNGGFAKFESVTALSQYLEMDIGTIYYQMKCKNPKIKIQYA